MQTMTTTQNRLERIWSVYSSQKKRGDTELHKAASLSCLHVLCHRRGLSPSSRQQSVSCLSMNREQERLKRIQDEGWDRYAPPSATNVK